MKKFNANIKQIQYLFDICTAYADLNLYPKNMIHIRYLFHFLRFFLLQILYKYDICYAFYYSDIILICMVQTLDKLTSDREDIDKIRNKYP